MRIIGIALVIVGVVGLILSGVLPEVGIPAIPGSVGALLSGIGFFCMCRHSC